MPAPALIEVTFRDDVAVVRLDRPAKRNALSGAMLTQLGGACAEACRRGARAVLVAASGTDFCAGADLAEVAAMTPERFQERNLLASAVFDALERLPVPTVAAIDGRALGGGLELALACTFRLATSRAEMGFPEIGLGVIPTYGGTRRLPALVGEARATEIILTGRRLDAREAERIGLVTRVVDDPVEASALAFAGELTRHSLAAQALAREALRLHRSPEDAARLAAEQRICARAGATADAAEGVRAFLERRPARFRDA